MDKLLAGLTPPELRGVQVLRVALDLYNRGEGTGLLAGKGRYATFEARARLAAYGARSLLQFWSRLCRLMIWPVSPVAADADLLALMSGGDEGFGRQVLGTLARDTSALVLLARYWHTTDKAAAREALPLFALTEEAYGDPE